MGQAGDRGRHLSAALGDVDRLDVGPGLQPDLGGGVPLNRRDGMVGAWRSGDLTNIAVFDTLLVVLAELAGRPPMGPLTVLDAVGAPTVVEVQTATTAADEHAQP